MRDEHLRSENWLDADNYPEITFAIKEVSDVKVAADNKMEAKVTGDFTAHGSNQGSSCRCFDNLFRCE